MMTEAAAKIYSAETELALLGCILIDETAYDDAAIILQSSDSFYLHQHRWTWEAFAALRADNLSIDSLTLKNELGRAGHLDECGGMDYINGLVTVVPTSMHAVEYARQVRSDFTRRRLNELASRIYQAAHSAEAPDQTARSYARELDQLAFSSHSRLVDMYDAVSAWYDQTEQWVTSGKARGIPFYLRALDFITDGLVRQQYRVLAGRPGMGKTSLAAHTVKNAARAGYRVGVFVCEDTPLQWAEIAVLSDLGLDKQCLKPAQMNQLAEKCREFYDLPVRFYKRSNLTPAEFNQKSREMARELGGLDLVVIDHLGAMNHSTANKSDNTAYAIGRTNKEIVRTLEDLNAAGLVLVQLSRESAKSGREPNLTDLRDSGEIEQDARLVVFAHRPAYYAESGQQPEDTRPQMCKLIISKHNDGKTGAVEVAYVPAYRRFADWERQPIDLRSI